MELLIGSLAWIAMGAVPTLAFLLFWRARNFTARLLADRATGEARVQVFKTELASVTRQLDLAHADVRNLTEQLHTADRTAERLSAEVAAAQAQTAQITAMLSEAYAHQRLVLERVVAPPPPEAPPAMPVEKWMAEMEQGGLWKDPREVAQERADREEAARAGGLDG